MKTKTVNIPASTAEITFHQYVGQRIKQRRTELGMTQYQVVDSCGISKGFFSDIENGKRSVGFYNMREIAKALGRSVDWFAEGWD